MKYVVGNWKMEPEKLSGAERLLASLAQELKSAPRDVTVVVCPPFIWLDVVAKLKPAGSALCLGAQDTFWETQGSYTGEVSPPMLSSLGVSYVIVGHSERRALGETNEVVAKKLRAVLDAAMTAVLCIGETSREGDRYEVIREETESALSVLGAGDLDHLVIAYEPVWAVGASEADTPQDALASILFIRKLVREQFGGSSARLLPVIYGGSVNAENAASFAAIEGIDGVLPGRASRDARQFAAIVQAFSRRRKESRTRLEPV